MSEKIKSGELRVAVTKEEPIWRDRKRIVFFGLPFSFTRYTLTPSKLLVDVGFFKRNEEEIRLYRITDVSLRRSFGERIFGLGTILLLSSDTSTPAVKLIHIRKAKTVKDVISQAIENARRVNGVHTSEMVMGAPRRPGIGPHHDGDDAHHDGQPPFAPPAAGPQIVPDMNHNGMDDRTE